MPEWKKGEQPDGSKTGRTEATNSQRMFKVLEVLKKHSDSNNRMTQEQILAALDFPEELIFNRSAEAVLEYVSKKRNINLTA